MIAQIRGVLAHKAADRVIVDVHGVGYDIAIPFSTYYELGDIGSEVALKIYTHVREDFLGLFGFLTVRERQIFLLLIQVTGIGPRLAISILSGLPVDELCGAISAKDVIRLSSIPGVGKKTAERIALELKDKITQLAPEASLGAIGPAEGGLGRDVVSALVNLGYQRSKAESAVSRLLRGGQIESFEVLLRQALKEMSN